LKIYTISGLGADQRVFQFLKLNTEIVPLNWIEVQPDDTIESYSKRLALEIDTTEDYVILGVSFGGLIATEITKVLKPKLTILISSTATRSKIPGIFRLFGHSKLLSILPASFFRIPLFIAKYFFGTKQLELLGDILKDTDPAFSKWALNQLILWKNETEINPVYSIGSAQDKLLPGNSLTSDILIKNGQHFMIVDKAPQISTLINHRISQLH
jgi:hypothetical protein